MPIIAGELDRRILLQRHVGARDTYGQPRDEWQDVATVWAKVRATGGGEAFNEPTSQRSARQMVEFTIRWRSDANPRLRVVWESRIYDVVDVAEMGRREGLVLRAHADDVQPGV